MRRASKAIAVLVTLAACGAPPHPAPPPLPSAPPRVASQAPAPPRADPSLVPRHVFWGNPDYAAVKVSPDGQRLGWLAAAGGVMNVWITSGADPATAAPVTHETVRDLHAWEWLPSGDDILYARDENGDENTHVFVLDLRTGKTKDLTPVPGVQARFEAMSDHDPRHVVLAMNDRDPKVHDLYRVDIVTGERTVLARNDGTITWWAIDRDLRARVGCRPDDAGPLDLLSIGSPLPWKPLLRLPFEDGGQSDVAGFDESGATLYFKDSRGRDTAALFAIDMKTGKETLLADDPRADIDGVLTGGADGHVEAVSAVYERRTWRVLDRAVEPDFRYLASVSAGDLEIVSRSRDESRWIVRYELADGPSLYYRYERGAGGGAGKATLLFNERKALAGIPLAAMEPFVIRSRDGLDLVSYVTRPRGAQHPGPMVLFVHGGPWDRVGWGWSSLQQWLASRGYASLSVNYRGSTGFGKKHFSAGIREWGGKMQDDLLDAVAWSIDHGIADPAKIAILGPSYGGYATLLGLARTPATFACGVDLYGIANLVTRLETIPVYDAAGLRTFMKLVGDPRTPEGRRFLLERSPITYVDAIEKPLLVVQGTNDPRVVKGDSDRMVAAMNRRGLPVTYLVYPDEGHGFARPENNASLFAVMEIFLAQCLGGPYEPVGGDFKGSSVTAPVGAERVHGLGEALGRK